MAVKKIKSPFGCSNPHCLDIPCTKL